MRGEMRFAFASLGLLLGSCSPHGEPTTARQNGSLPQGVFDYHATPLPGELRPIGAAAPAFARYLNDVHRRVHPIFADMFLTLADRRPANDPLQNQSLAATVELVIDGRNGRIVRLGIVRTSGLTMFDGGAIVSINQAAPFGVAPAEIRSPDGNVHLEWELRRDQLACSTLGMHPFLFKP
jgi:hypothetical protein